MTTETIPALLRDGGDPAVRPQDDLFRHVNGTWLREHVIPSDRSADGEFLRLRDLSEERVRDIIQDAAEHAEDAVPDQDAPAGADATRAAARKIGDLYAAFMDEAAIESAGVAPLEADLAPLRAATTRDELALALTDRALRGVRSLVGLGVGADINDPENYTFYAAQSGIGLPDESYYREPDNAEIREKYRAHLAELRDFYRLRRDAMQVALEEHFSDLATWQVPQGGLFFWLTLKHKQDTRQLLAAAMAEQVAFMPGEPFFVDPEANPGYLRLNFSHVPPEKLSEGLRRLAAVIRQAQGVC